MLGCCSDSFGYDFLKTNPVSSFECPFFFFWIVSTFVNGFYKYKNAGMVKKTFVNWVSISLWTVLSKSWFTVSPFFEDRVNRVFPFKFVSSGYMLPLTITDHFTSGWSHPFLKLGEIRSVTSLPFYLYVSLNAPSSYRIIFSRGVGAFFLVLSWNFSPWLGLSVHYRVSKWTKSFTAPRAPKVFPIELIAVILVIFLLWALSSYVWSSCYRSPKLMYLLTVFSR